MASKIEWVGNADAVHGAINSRALPGLPQGWQIEIRKVAAARRGVSFVVGLYDADDNLISRATKSRVSLRQMKELAEEMYLKACEEHGDASL